MPKIGVLTFHRAYNYGAVIQAYSIQNVIEDIGYDCEIIDYVNKQQISYYTPLVYSNGVRKFVKDLIFIGYLKQIKKKNRLFDQFIEKEIKKSKKSCNNEFDAFVVGSDQVWNPIHSNDFRKAYVLDFVDDNHLKLAYAPSIGAASLEDLSAYKNYINEFKELSCREQRGAEVLKQLTDRDVQVLLDPTLIVEKSKLHFLADKAKSENENYIFYYTLDGFDKRKNGVKLLKDISKLYDMKVKVIAPTWPKMFSGFENIMDASPEKFLNLIKNASLVCTNSFHGMALSIDYKKEFFVLEEYDGKDDRKISLLKKVGLEERMTTDIKDISKLKDKAIDYSKVDSMLQDLKEKSINYLKRNLDGYFNI